MAVSRVALVLLGFTATLVVGASIGEVLKSQVQAQSQGSDYYLMRLQECSGVTTLHGLWPQWAEDCSGPAFDVNALSSIRNEMNTNWPSCEGSGGNVAFWQHEWEKHGTCSRLAILQYFTTALNLHQQYADQGVGDYCFDTDFNKISCPAGVSAVINDSAQLLKMFV